MNALLLGGSLFGRDLPPGADSIAVRDGRIARLGSRAEAIAAVPEGTARWELGGRPLLPGFQDAHSHLMQFGVGLTRPSVNDAGSLEEALATFADACSADRGGGLLIGEGFDETRWTKPRRPTRDELDTFAPDRPFIARRVCGHVGVANSRALALLAERWDGPGVNPATGLLDEGPVVTLDDLFPLSPEEARHAARRGAAAVNALGLTSVTDFPHHAEFRLWSAHVDLDALTVRVALWPRAPQPDAAWAAGPQHDRAWVAGAKFFSDGAIGGRSAKVRVGYTDRPDHFGEFVHEPDALAAAVRHEVGAGRAVAIHAIGDHAIEMVLDTFASLPPSAGAAGHRIEHLEMASPGSLDRVRELDLVASVQPNFLQWQHAGGLYETALGSQRTAQMNAFRSQLDAGCRVAFGSDGMPAGPLFGVRCAMNHPKPEERLDETTALRLYTEHASDATPHARSRGRLEVGERADLTVLRDWPSRAEFDHADLTLLEGEVVHSRAEAWKPGADAPVA